MIGVVIPAHNEEEYLGACLDALRAAATCPQLGGEVVHIVIVLDACSDHSQRIVMSHAMHTDLRWRLDWIAVEDRNVGAARAAGAALLLERGARWLAFTDADTRVSAAWLSTQLSLDADAVCGSVAVDDWSPHQQHVLALREHFARTYNDADGHHHIHGTNLGVRASAYVRAGGFAPLACSEDVALVDALEASGAHIVWSAAPRVNTSARRNAKARGGFGDTLLQMVEKM
ncbi:MULTISPECIES: glycosyltransferase family 2 protein [unclassified Janthinobacterium]|uniref:glycosyltransferase n=1 Tax=unclassified Janthinobacterium TaxID=2610881 RepID=UPI0016101703|nr:MULTISPECIES: glycosyltransferase [unclassified Janthinobacterium]MBB5367207.1 glycosyltransferase involved in cell wall biosynthesis [Janthinobacterium sp. K2C7]MBB5380315.1 glycosyltransferase involved in cell wall biosynthesis [Janthinobacterium sp. K2Li3]MBB5385589.1 glycosyltransferase involved in cell wall biosynthesis [Janthinobacterium sp. K2E3]